MHRKNRYYRISIDGAPSGKLFFGDCTFTDRHDAMTYVRRHMKKFPADRIKVDEYCTEQRQYLRTLFRKNAKTDNYFIP